MRLFELHRKPKTPKTKLSVATCVGEGAEFSDGSVAVRFPSPSPHTCQYESMAAVALIGALEALIVRWIFEPVSTTPTRPPPLPKP